MSIPKNSNLLYILTQFPPQINPIKIHKIHIHLYTFYYTIHKNQIHPLILAKPNSTQKPYYFPEMSPSLNTLDQTIHYYQLNSSTPLLP